MDNTAILSQLGFSEQEIDVYLSLLSLGGAKASTVAKDTGMQRTAVYHTLKKMAKSGYVHTYYKGKTHYYHAQKPHRLAANYSKKLDNLYAFLPKLQALEKKGEPVVGLRFIQSIRELKEFYTDILDEYRDREYAIIGSANAWEGLDADWFKQFRYDRGRNKIKTRLLLTDESKNINPEEETLLREVRFLPDQYSFKSTIDIFENKILVVSTELSSLAVVIEIPAMGDVFQAMFDMLWEFVGATS
jgi:sugar-specific transcriptional regulator TrmB